MLLDFGIGAEMKPAIILVTLRYIHTYGVFEASGQFRRKCRDGGHIQPEGRPVNDRVQEVNFV